MGQPGEENVFADIDEYIEDTNAIVPPIVDVATFKVKHSLILMLKAEGFFRNSTDDDPTQYLRNVLAKNAADGSFVDKTFARVTQIQDKMAEQNQAWHSEDTTGGITYGTPSLTNMIKDNQERDQIIVELTTNVNVLTKMFTESQTKKEDIKDNLTKVQDNNTNGGLARKGKATNNGEMTKHWKESPSSDSKLESMIERMLQNHERSDTSMKNMTKLVGSHTSSIQKLEMQMRDLSREQNPKLKGPLPSNTIETQKVKIQEVNNEEDKEKVIETPKNLAPIPRPPPPFPQRLATKVDDSKLEKFYDILKKLSVNIPFVEEFQEMPGFTKYLKDVITKKRTTKNKVVNVTHRVSSIIATTTVLKKEDLGAFTIPCTIGLHNFARALCDNGASINLMPLAI
ncbi:uncharacterized protein [Nicotiana tomentosiformis]|uniref:uncharacterized protein n=1 Tax=Nicotiana tomentosiformis TaxID=4098 RepID=UPI00388CCAA5